MATFGISLNHAFLNRSYRTPLQSANRTDKIIVSIYPKWYSQISLEWSVPIAWGNVVFNVYFSPVADSDFVKINSTPIDGTFFIDTSTREYSKFDHGYYVVECILLDKDSLTVRSDPMTWNSTNGNMSMRRKTELFSIEVQRREYWLLSRFSGVKSYLFRRKSYGMRCKVCWNPKLEKVLDDRCPNCLGTSFDGGYFAPAPLFVNYEPTPNTKEQTYFGRMEANQIGARTISIPEIRDGDVLVRTSDWNMYTVKTVQTTELTTRTVSQLMTLIQLSKNEIEYTLVKRGLPEFPERFQ